MDKPEPIDEETAKSLLRENGEELARVIQGLDSYFESVAATLPEGLEATALSIYEWELENDPLICAALSVALGDSGTVICYHLTTLQWCDEEGKQYFDSVEAYIAYELMQVQPS